MNIYRTRYCQAHKIKNYEKVSIYIYKQYPVPSSTYPCHVDENISDYSIMGLYKESFESNGQKKRAWQQNLIGLAVIFLLAGTLINQGGLHGHTRRY